MKGGGNGRGRKAKKKWKNLKIRRQSLAPFSFLTSYDSGLKGTPLYYFLIMDSIPVPLIQNA